jgi:hypothetical protein
MCFEKRKTPVCIIAVLSVITLLAGILMIAFAFMFTNSAILENIGKEDKTVKDGKDLIFMILLIFSLSTIVIGGLGFLFKCVKNRCFACTYGIVLLPTWIVVLVVGLLALAAAVTSEEAIQSTCLTINSDYKRQYGTAGSEVTISFDIYSALGMNEYMCRQEHCPCAPGAWSASWNDSPLSPQLNFAGTIKSYKECMTNPPATSSTDFKNFASGFTSQADYSDVSAWISFFEDEYDCAGICTPAQFYWGKSIESGRPTQSCIGKMKDSISSPFKGLAVATIICGIFLFFIFIMQYCLWRKYD